MIEDPSLKFREWVGTVTTTRFDGIVIIVNEIWFEIPELLSTTKVT